MEYATGDAQKGPVLLELPLNGMISNSKLHHTHNHAVDVVDTQVKGDLERHEKRSQGRNHTSASNLYQSYLLLVSV